MANAGPAGPAADGDYPQRAAAVYRRYAGPFRKRFGWLRPGLFTDALAADLRADAAALLNGC